MEALTAKMTKYYTEYPKGYLYAKDDDEVLVVCSARLIYRESDTEDGRPFIVIRDNTRIEK